jgi:2-oxo-4-hydroxy-4-carboxy-5-ureidoimidazoline decarboxylase
MNQVLERWNASDAKTAAATVLPCCGSHAWAEALTSLRPFADSADLRAKSSEVWRALPQQEWQEAFDSHPRIGEQKAQGHATAESLKSSAQEQAVALSADDATSWHCATRIKDTSSGLGVSSYFARVAEAQARSSPRSSAE